MESSSELGLHHYLESIQRGEACNAPTQAKVRDVAIAMATDVWGNVQYEKKKRAEGLLWSPNIKRFHFTLGAEPVRLPRTLFRTVPHNLSGDVPDLDFNTEVNQRRREEERRKDRKTMVLPVSGINLADLLPYRDEFIAEGLWPKGFDSLCGANISNSSKIRPQAAQSSESPEFDSMAQAIANVLGYDNHTLKEKRVLKCEIAPVMKKYGYIESEIESKFKNLDKQRELKVGRNEYKAVLVINRLVAELRRKHNNDEKTATRPAQLSRVS